MYPVDPAEQGARNSLRWTPSVHGPPGAEPLVLHQGNTARESPSSAGRCHGGAGEASTKRRQVAMKTAPQRSPERP